jgi:molybdopterin synthase sulfur carrier subunit
MAVVVHLPGPLRPLAGGHARIALEAGPDVAAALAALYALHPALRDRIQDERGELRGHVNVFVGTENVRDARGLATLVAPGAELHILPAVSGG